MSRILIILTVLAVVAGCKTANDFAGSGPIQVRAGTKAFIDKYTKLGNSIVALSYDGNYAYAYACPFADGCRQVDIDATIPIAKCEEKASKCGIYSNLGFIVWDGRVSVGSGGRVSARGKSDKEICNFAITSDKGGLTWETRDSYLDEVAEAKRRGFTPQSCEKLIN